MKPLVILFVLFFITFTPAQAQTTETYKTGYLKAHGDNIYLDGEKMKPREVKELFSEYPEALAQYRGAKTIQGSNYAISAAAGVLIGFELGTYLSAGYINGAPLAIGCGLAATGIVLQIVSNNKIARSVYLYKDKKNSTVSLTYGLVGSGAGLKLTF